MTLLRAAILIALLSTVAGCMPEPTTEPADRSPAEPVYVPDDIVAALIEAGRITYRPDAPGRDEWQRPAETRRRGTGDCEDICLLLQDTLARDDIHVELVFGLKTSASTNGHCWCEYTQDGQTYIIEPRSNALYRRSRLPDVLYIPAEKIDVVADKIAAYHERSGVWVNTAYRDWILAGRPAEP